MVAVMTMDTCRRRTQTSMHYFLKGDPNEGVGVLYHMQCACEGTIPNEDAHKHAYICMLHTYMLARIVMNLCTNAYKKIYTQRCLPKCLQSLRYMYIDLKSENSAGFIDIAANLRKTHRYCMQVHLKIF